MAAAAIALVGCILVTSSLAQNAPQVVRGQRPAVVERLKPLDYCGPSNRLNLVVGLPLRNQTELDRLLHDLYDPASPRYHQYLTPVQFTDRFAPTQRDYNEVTRFAASNGLAVIGTHPNRTLLDVAGSIADIEKAFHVRMAIYQHPTLSRKFYAPDADPSVNLAVPLSGIVGLDNFILPHPMNLKTNFGSDQSDAVAGPKRFRAERLLSGQRFSSRLCAEGRPYRRRSIGRIVRVGRLLQLGHRQV